MSLKAAPKTFNQVRNFLYLSAAFYGYIHGRHEKFDNDALWATHQKKQWQEEFNKKEAARLAAHPPSTDIPASVPEELGDLYKAFSQ
eukprot:CAMPEP_0176444096 /NCGR_PEP_ID=MMETSP0127-20121128/22854_1 /TAXON_ID=938130 /ORGANISM="Platyophrya macrostoma, Strain WH" /LENGTH=86 /DNA_ID=CAMNT_0017829529 /DNA_START=38 /DNA_END=298 /DNA_ORIENTATION=-